MYLAVEGESERVTNLYGGENGELEVYRWLKEIKPPLELSDYKELIIGISKDGPPSVASPFELGRSVCKEKYDPIDSMLVSLLMETDYWRRVAEAVVLPGKSVRASSFNYLNLSVEEGGEGCVLIPTWNDPVESKPPVKAYQSNLAGSLDFYVPSEDGKSWEFFPRDVGDKEKEALGISRERVVKAGKTRIDIVKTYESLLMKTLVTMIGRLDLPESIQQNILEREEGGMIGEMDLFFLMTRGGLSGEGIDRVFKILFRVMKNEVVAERFDHPYPRAILDHSMVISALFQSIWIRTGGIGFK